MVESKIISTYVYVYSTEQLKCHIRFLLFLYQDEVYIFCRHSVLQFSRDVAFCVHNYSRGWYPGGFIVENRWTRQMPSPFDSIMPRVLLPLLTLPYSKAVSIIERPQPPPGIVCSTKYCLYKCVMCIRIIIYLAITRLRLGTWYLIDLLF